MKKKVPFIAAGLLALFGLLTLFLSSSVIFDLFGIRAKEGNYVLFVVWANFISSLIYLFAAYGFLKNKIWTALLLAISVAVLVIAYLGLIIHANSGGVYETKTMGAMVFRITATMAFLVAAFFLVSKKQRNVL